LALDAQQLQALQNRLNQDETLRNEFLKSPVATLKKEGVELTAEQAKSAEAQVAELQKAARLPPGITRPTISISITISIRF
jgi:hypothetical protein